MGGDGEGVERKENTTFFYDGFGIRLMIRAGEGYE